MESTHRKHQDNQDHFLRYINKKIKALTKKLESITTASPQPTEQPQQSSKLIEKRKQIQDQIQQFNSMRQHYFNSLVKKDEKQDWPLEMPPTIFSLCHTLAQLSVYHGLAQSDTIVKQEMKTLPKDIGNSFKQAFILLQGNSPVNQGLELRTVIQRRAVELERHLTGRNLAQCLSHLSKLQPKVYSEAKQEIVMEEAEAQESQGQGSINSAQVLKDKKNRSSSDKQQQNYEGDQEIVTGQSDCKNDSEKDIKQRKISKKKAATKATKQFVEEENYYASQEQGKHKKGHPATVLNWRIKGEQEYDTDKQKKVLYLKTQIPDTKNVKKSAAN